MVGLVKVRDEERNTSFMAEMFLKNLCRGPSVDSQCGRWKDVMAVGVRHVEG